MIGSTTDSYIKSLNMLGSGGTFNPFGKLRIDIMCGGGSNSWNRGSSGSGDSGSEDNSGGVPPEVSEDPQESESEDPCIISETTELDSTNTNSLADQSEGDIFPIVLRNGVPYVIDFEDRIVGSITGPLGEQLVNCIESGYSYRAEILEIDGNKCRVRVTNKCVINSTATLASPNPEPLDEVSEGAVLSVEVRDGSLCTVDDQNRIIGSLAKPWTKILIECIESGLEYEAEVTEINGGFCEVLVRNSTPEE